MKPQQIEAWLEQLGQPSADRDYKPGHERMQALLKPLACREPKLRIRIVGTNGKGSTASMLAAGLKAAGLSVGLYISPHVLRFNERISIHQQCISDDDLLAYLERIMPMALQAQASYFEVATALALYHFSQHHVDVEILEAGVGARLDATTAVPADMALITPIGLDHQAWLGESLAEVAEEKAYVLDGCKWGVSAAQDASVLQILKQHMGDLREAKVWKQDCSMLGYHQNINAGLACAALDVLVDEGVVVADTDTIQGKAVQAVIPGRLQHVSYQEADIWLDAAHNQYAVQALLPVLPSLAQPFDAILIYTREDRNLEDSLHMLSSLTKHMVSNIQHDEIDVCIPDIAQALQYVLKIQPQAKILILGSFLSVAAGLKAIGH